ncbi:MAG: type VI secretion lipoprotein TssJ [Deltaproteobacteria bacterium]|nr:type VI secretion lipoprotein TssJ [Deltaproteobacteria bacterium]
MRQIPFHFSRLFWVGLLALGLLASCGKKDPPLTPPAGPPAKTLGDLAWVYGPRQIRIGIIADADLNLTGDAPAALSVCVYQLSDSGGFDATRQTQAGLSSLADCPPQSPDGSGAPALKGFVSAERVFVQPGERRDLVLDRQPGAQFVGVAGGFSSLPPTTSSGFLAIPIQENHHLIFANTFQILDFRAWLILHNQTLNFYFKSGKDYDALAGDFPPAPPYGALAPCPAPTTGPDGAPLHPPGALPALPPPPAPSPSVPGASPASAPAAPCPVAPAASPSAPEASPASTPTAPCPNVAAPAAPCPVAPAASPSAPGATSPSPVAPTDANAAPSAGPTFGSASNSPGAQASPVAAPAPAAPVTAPPRAPQEVSTQ